MKNKNDMNNRVLLGLVLLLISPFISMTVQAESGELEANWKLISDRNEIQVYARHTDNSRLKTFKGVTRIAFPDEYVMVAIFNDYENIPKWLHLIDGATEISRESPLKRDLRFTTHLPWPLTDREAVLTITMEEMFTHEDEGLTFVLENIPDRLPRNKKYIRFPELEGVFKMRRLPNNEAEITYQVVLDPGGYVPTWLVNLLLRDAPYFTLEKLRRFSLQPEYQGHYYDYVNLRGPGRPETAEPVRSYIYPNQPAS